MARRSLRVPSYRHHKPSGQAVVTLDGRDHYLGLYDSAVSKAAYDRLVGEWQANGRRLPAPSSPTGPTVSEVLAPYWRFAEQHYRKGGQPTSQLRLVKTALKVLRELYGTTPAAEFGPLALKVVRQRFIDAGLSRSTVNSHVDRVRRAFRWAVEQELIAGSTYHALRAVRGLAKGRSPAPDHPPVAPAVLEHVQAILPLLRPPVRAMVELQLLTGMRPGEVVLMRGRDIDRSGSVWKYTPSSHKTEHHDQTRIILLGPKAQEVLRPWLDVDPETYLFRPRPFPATPKRPRPRTGRWAPGPRYQERTYAARVRAACDRAGVPQFSPNRIRHLAATRIRAEFGLEAAQVILGHARADVTQIYAERDLAKAVEIAGTIG